MKEAATSRPKQMIIMRKDLNMRKGKMVAQGAHASLKAILDLGHYSDVYSHVSIDDEHFVLNIDKNLALKEWMEGKFAKICVSVNSEQELLDIIQKAKDAGLITSLITDAGLTEFNGVSTITCGAIGPAYPEQLDPITGHLPLL
jgi:PTH2 family peptidyl-tRNA hydrolase